ncbi:MAG: hypothetical protein HY650_06190 [Acidobacteria bacterium]|nr:hypothetical protein [Acidobacteriota bacterium]
MFLKVRMSIMWLSLALCFFGTVTVTEAQQSSVLTAALGSAQPGNAQTGRPKRIPDSAKKDPCAGLMEEAAKLGADSAWGLARSLMVTGLSGTPNRFSTKVLIENFDSSSGLQYAAAQVIRDHFPDRFAIEPEAALVLHISGTSRSSSGAQSISVELYTYMTARFRTGQIVKPVPGTLNLAGKTTLLVNYSLQETTDNIKSMVYEVLAEFVAKWEKAEAE